MLALGTRKGLTHGALQTIIGFNPTFNITFDASWTGGQTASVLTPALNAATAFLSSIIFLPKPLTFQIKLAYVNISGSVATSSRVYFTYTINYANFLIAYQKNITTANAQTAFNNFPATSPFTGAYSWSPCNSICRLFGVKPNSDTTIDGSITFDSSASFFFGTPVGGAYDALGISLHEATEVLGRVCHAPDTNAQAGPWDMFRMTGPGAYIPTVTYGGFFSIDGGNTLGRAFNTAGSPTDLGDWKTGVDNDCCNYTGPTNTILPFSSIDREMLDVMGYSAA